MHDSRRSLRIRRSAWDQDVDVDLPIPDRWRVHELRLAPSHVLTSPDSRAACVRPVAWVPLESLDRGKRNVGIIIDDLTRPTRADELLTPLLEILASVGVRVDDLTLFVACGSHEAPSRADIERKAGDAIREFRNVVVHDCHTGCRDLGRTRRGTPVAVNAELLACDLRIGVGSVFPHPAAAFSGGSKLLVPGMCGAATIRFLHDHTRPARERGGELDCEMRDEMRVIADMVGLHHVILAVPGPDRRAVACIAGAPEEALTRAVRAYRPLATVPMPSAGDVDALIIDAYPFDSTLQFAHDRALWPIKEYPADMPVVILAHCQRGAGTHEFFPAADPFVDRIVRRVRGFKRSDLRRIPEILNNALALRAERQRTISIMAPGLSTGEVRRVFPRGVLCETWDEACRWIDTQLPEATPRVAFFSTAPLLLPERQEVIPGTL